MTSVFQELNSILSHKNLNAYLLIFAFSLPLLLFGNNKKDSLIAVFYNKNIDIETRAKSVSVAINRHIKFSNPDSGITISEEFKRFATKNKLTKWEAQANRTLGSCYKLKGDYNIALAYYKKGLNLFKSIPDSNGMCDAYNDIGTVFKLFGSVDNALKYNNASLEISKALKDSSRMVINQVNMAVIMKNQKEYDMALDYLKQSLEVSKRLNRPQFLVAIYNNIGTTYQTTNKPDSALKYLLLCKELLKKMNLPHRQGGLTGNLATVYFDLKQDSLAKEYLNKSYRLAKQYNDPYGESIALYKLGDFYKESNDLDSAIIFIQNSYDLSLSGNFLINAARSANLLSKLYTQKGDYLAAYNIKQIARNHEDSSSSQQMLKEISKSIVQNELEAEEFKQQKKKEELKRIEKNRTERRNQLEFNIIVIGIIMLFLILLLMARFSPPAWLIELVVFMLFLIIFEFLLVLSDPYIDSFTQKEPLKKLLINASLGGIIFPLHALLENLLKRTLLKSSKVGKNA